MFFQSTRGAVQFTNFVVQTYNVRIINLVHSESTQEIEFIIFCCLLSTLRFDSREEGKPETESLRRAKTEALFTKPRQAEVWLETRMQEIGTPRIESCFSRIAPLANYRMLV